MIPHQKVNICIILSRQFVKKDERCLAISVSSLASPIVRALQRGPIVVARHLGGIPLRIAMLSLMVMNYSLPLIAPFEADGGGR